jgi:hypothetical protein
MSPTVKLLRSYSCGLVIGMLGIAVELRDLPNPWGSMCWVVRHYADFQLLPIRAARKLFDGGLVCLPTWLAAARSHGQVVVITTADTDLCHGCLSAIHHATSTGRRRRLDPDHDHPAHRGERKAE